MSELSAIIGFINALSSVISTLKKMMPSKHMPKIEDLGKIVMSLEEAVVSLQEDVGSLLKEKIKKSEDSDPGKLGRISEVGYYPLKLKETWVIVPKGKEEPLFCPVCFGQNHESILMWIRPEYRGKFPASHRCPVCREPFDLE